MAAFANSLTTNLSVTALVLALVFVLPWMDRKICERLGLNLQGGVSKNPEADTLMRIRLGVLYLVFLIYLCTMAYLVLFSRQATQEYQVHVALFKDLLGAVQIDLGFFGFVRSIFTDGVSKAFSHVQVIRPEDITQVYMNIMLFFPMGYLLPYLFSWFRAKVRIRPVLACFVISFLIENLQLVFRRGFYDLDDLISNVIGGLIGQYLFLSVAYVVTHPHWRKELKSYQRWKKHARKRTLYPFARKMGLARTTLQAVREETIWDFYIMKMGFRLIGQTVPLDTAETNILLQMGKLQVEVHCINQDTELAPQTLTLSVRKLAPVIRCLKKNGIAVSEIGQDVYTNLRCIHFDGPDNTNILIIEK